MKTSFKFTLSIVILVIILGIMYASNVGIPGIMECWQDFKLLDMQFSYSTDIVSKMINYLGAEGIKHYLYYFVVDLTFIIALLYVQLQLTSKLTTNESTMRKLLYTFASSRAVFDILEDSMIAMIIKSIIPIKFVPIASFLTSIKFICLYAWVGFLIFDCVKIKVLSR